MRVLQVHTAYRLPGAEDAVVRAEARLLREGGHEVVQVHAANPEGGLAAARATALAPWNPRAARALGRVVRDHRPDVVHVHNTWFAMSPAVVAALGDAPPAVVMTLHNYRLVCPAGTLYHHGARCHDCIDGGPWRAVAHRCYYDSAALSAVAAATVTAWRRSGALEAVDAFIALTPSSRELFVRAGLPADRILVRPHRVPDPGPRVQAPSRSSTLLFVGRAVPEKGLGELLGWWGSRPRRWRLEVLGDGPVIAELGGRVPPGVVLRGVVAPTAVTDAMRAARALLVPARWDEPFGLVAVEALAAGLPVASSGMGGLGDIHGPDGGWIAPPAADGGWDDDPWEDVLAGADGIADDAGCDRRGIQARRRYEADYSPEGALDSLEAVYRAARGRPDPTDTS